MRWYPWLHPYFEQLITNYQAGKGHHALLVKTLPGMGDTALIHAVICFLMCKQPNGQKSCKKCHSCQLMKAKTHPDYHIIKPENNTKLIGMDCIIDINKKLYEHAYLSGSKVVWCTDATLLTKAASNSLLKILEEPPKKTWFFFSCPASKRLLPTLISRCCLYHLTVPKIDWSLNWLQQETKVSKDVAMTALNLCSSAPAAALDLLNKDNHWTQRNRLCSALNNTLEGCNWLNLLKILDHEHVLTHLYWLISLLLDGLKLQYNAVNITNIDVYLLVDKISRIFNSHTLYSIIHSLSQCREQLLTVTSLNRELILTNQLLTIEYYLKLGKCLPINHI